MAERLGFRAPCPLNRAAHCISSRWTKQPWCWQATTAFSSHVTREESWHQANLSELLIDDLAPVRGALVISSARGSLFLSRDGGKTWGHLDGPDAENTLSALRSYEAGNQLIAVSATEGLFILDMGASSSASVSPSPRQ